MGRWRIRSQIRRRTGSWCPRHHGTCPVLRRSHHLEVEEEAGPLPPPQLGAQRLDVARSFLQNQQSLEGRKHPKLPWTYATSSIIINGIWVKTTLLSCITACNATLSWWHDWLTTTTTILRYLLTTSGLEMKWNDKSALGRTTVLLQIWRRLRELDLIRSSEYQLIINFDDHLMTEWSSGNLDEIFKEMVAKREKLSSCERNQK